MGLVTTKFMFEKAMYEGYAIGAFNINNMEFIQAITDAANEAKSPVILQVSSSAIKYARMEYLHAIGFDYKGLVEAGYYLYVTHVDIYYKASAFLDDKLLIEVFPTKLKKISGELKQIIKKEDGTICADATVTWACVTKEGRPSKIPEEFMVSGLIPEEA